MSDIAMTAKEKELYREIHRLRSGIRVGVEQIYADGLDGTVSSRILLYHLEKLGRGGIKVPEEVL